ncbi:hypothetical protein FDZ74_17395 [bacterium]|nr:MAG: hypothetical protein FDZ74_17395 [bacterium]
MEKLPHNIPPAEREKTRADLENLCQYAHNTIAAIEAGAPCEDIFSIFSKVKATAASVDASLLAYHVQHCLVPGLRMFREILAAGGASCPSLPAP